MRRIFASWGAVLVATAIVGCPAPTEHHGATPSPPSAQTTVHTPCAGWPLGGDCVRRLAVTADMMCAAAGQRWFCWGPGTARFPERKAGEGIVSLSSKELEPLVVDDDARARPKPQPDDAPMWCEAGELLSCGHDGIPDRLEPDPGIGLPRDGRISKVIAGTDYACALVNERVWCFGRAHRSQRGAPQTELLTRALPPPSGWAPNQVDLGGEVSSLVAKDNTTCALTDGSTYCWGDGAFFPPGALEHFTQPIVELFRSNSSPEGVCMVTASREVYCGELGHYQHVAPLDHAEQVVRFNDGPDRDELCARSASGEVRCVGLGGGEVKRRTFLEPATELLPPYPCALTPERSLRCDAHRLPDAPATAYPQLGTIVATSSLRSTSCVLDDAGKVACWRQVGWHHGTPESPYAPISEDVAAPRVLSSTVKMGELSGACARGEDGSVWRIGLMNAPPRNVLDLELQLLTAKGATGAVRLEGCTAYGEQGPAFVLGPPNVSWNERTLADRPQLLPVGAEQTSGAPEPKAFWDSDFNRCVALDAGGVECRAQDSTDSTTPARTYDPFMRATRPLRVIPPPPTAPP